MRLPAIGDVVLGSFRLERQLGAGSFGVAFLAEQLGTDRRAVVKVPHPHLLSGPRGPTIRERFETEARAATRIAHPNVVTVYTVGELDDGAPAMAMEFVEGESLEARLRTHAPLPLIQLGALGEQLGEALLALHGQGIVHRDISPGNVIVHERGAKLVVKLLDFGVARLLDLPSRASGPVGTPGYIAPEQRAGEVTARADIYSLGAILWWALTGHERVARSADPDPSPLSDPSALRPDTPPRLAAIVSRMLAVSDASRPSIDGFLHGWRAALDAIAVPQTHLLNSSSYSTELAVEARVALLIDGAVMRTLVTRYLESMVKTRVCSARSLTQAAPGAYAAVVVDADHAGVDVRELLQVLRHRYPDMGQVVVGDREQGGRSWAAFGADAFVAIPAELDKLGDAVSVHVTRRRESETSGRFHRSKLDRIRARPHHREEIERFIGSMPWWLAEIELALTRGEPARAVAPCTQLLDNAVTLDLPELVRLARATHAFIATHDVDAALPFVKALERAYHEVFHELVPVLQPSTPDPRP